MASPSFSIVRVAAALAIGLCAAAAASPLPADTPLFSSDDPVDFRLSAPFNELFDRARTDDEYSVAGTLGYTHAGQEVSIDGVRVSLPPQASITWPVLPHNPYTKDGHAEPAEGRIVITLPFSAEVLKHELTITVTE